VDYLVTGLFNPKRKVQQPFDPLAVLGTVLAHFRKEGVVLLPVFLPLATVSVP